MATKGLGAVSSMDPKRHRKGCKFRLAATCALAVECEHGYDVCPMCDPCTCHESPAPAEKAVR